MRPLEHNIQEAFFDYVHWKANGDFRYRSIISIPNAGKRSFKAARYFIAEGLSAGFPDVAVLVPTIKYPGMFIEFKRIGEKPTKQQIKWLRLLKSLGYYVCICYSAQEGIDELERYFSYPLIRVDLPTNPLSKPAR